MKYFRPATGGGGGSQDLSGYVTQEELDAAIAGTGGGGGGGGGAPMYVATNAANQHLPNNASTQANFNSVLKTDAAHFALSDGGVSILTPGHYRVSTYVEIGTGGEVRIEHLPQFGENSLKTLSYGFDQAKASVYFNAGQADSAAPKASWLIRADANDRVRVRVYNNTGGNQYLYTGGQGITTSYLMIEKIADL